MRVLIATVAERTNFIAAVPIAWALRTAGHEVRVASQPRLMEVIADAGLTAVPVGRDHDFWRVMRSRAFFDPLRDSVPPFDLAGLPMEEITWEPLQEGYRQIVPWWWRLVNEPMLDDLVALCRDWRPDLVLWEPSTFAAAVAAKVCGAAHGRFLWGVDVFAFIRTRYVELLAEEAGEEREDVPAAWLGACAARFGERFSEDLITGQFTVDCLPMGMRLGESGVRYVPVRYIPYNGRAVVPSWLREPPARRRVCLTLGTSATERQGGYVVSVQDLLDSLGELDMELVITLPEAEQQRLTRVPANTRLVSHVPLHALAPSCSAVINHGGAGTVLTMLHYGVPQLIIPRPTFDEPLLTRQMVRQGAAVSIPSAQARGERVRAELEKLLADEAVHRATADLHRRAHALPAPNAVVPLLEELAVHDQRASGVTPQGGSGRSSSVRKPSVPR
ncbi:activator-dependent family glycosyltransferase [Nonomuraea sp. SYSU D8015]|uniref:activator-dependent family glycosyltransferase n=1 Tax=Nonomuraea sp. SYSU D8015 TaxID=2593644 RepID=UPI00166055BB|nr:activator-dependent family glycosyltransferase [Nonomuraea sp. SYSU D8015]